MHDRLRAAAESPVFAITAAPYLLLDADLTIRAINASYSRATMRDPDELVGEFMFDAFPDNPEDPGADGVAHLGLSFERVLSSGRAHAMGLQRYDIPVATSDADGGAAPFLAKTWAPVNSPVTADGDVVGVLHHVEDVTEAHRTFSAADPRVRELFTPGLRHALLLVNRASRLGAGAEEHTRGGGDLLRPYRDHIWHELVHAVRDAPTLACAEAMCEVVGRLLPGIEGVAVTVSTAETVPRRPLQVAATSAWVLRAEELQYVTGEGPALDALSTGRPSVNTAPSFRDPRWPGYAEAASHWGVTATASYPLMTRARAFGTMTVYCRTSRQRLPDQPMATALAGVVAAVLREDLDQRELSPLFDATGFDQINIAIGMLAAALRIPISDAEARLRAAAYLQDQSLADLAEQVIARQKLGLDDLL